MIDCEKLLVSLGVIIVDDIVLPDGRSKMGVLGGGATHAVMGMRCWSECVGLVSPVGVDFPDALVGELATRFDVQGLLRRPQRTSRCWQLFELDGKRNEVHRTPIEEMLEMAVRPEEFPAAYRSLAGIHLHAPPPLIPTWVENLHRMGSPYILWEPWDPFCAPENWAAYCERAPLVECVSPNLREGRLLTGRSEPEEVAARLLEGGARMALLRMGADGILLAGADGLRLALPAVPVDPIVDVTGAGNACCGGFIAGMVQTGAPFEAACMSVVSASFVLEQFGAVFSVGRLLERAAERLVKYRRSLPNPRRPVFEHMASTWDHLPKPPDLEAKLGRIAAAGCISPGGWVLDIGTGTGGLLPFLIAQKPGQVAAVDLALEMLGRAGHTCPGVLREVGGENVTPLCADAESLPFAAKSFDVAYCHGVFPHFSRPDLVLANLKRVVRPGGRLVISLASGRERINAIHASHPAALLHNDRMPPAAELVARLETDGWKVETALDEADFYLVVACN